MPSARESLQAAAEKLESTNEPTAVEATEEVGQEATGALLAPASEADSGGDSVGAGVDTPASSEPDASHGVRARDASGKFVAKPTDSTEAPKPGAKALVKPSPTAATNKTPAQAAKPGAATPQTTATQPPAQGTPSVPKYKAPAGWKLAPKEKWGTLSEDIQAEIDRREREISQALNESAEPRKFHQRFNEVLAPYQAMLGGADPIKTTQNLFQMAYNLQHGAPQQKAQLVAHLVKQFGVDIGALDSALSGQPGQAQPAQAQTVDPDEIARRAEERAMQRWQQQQSQQKVEEFGQGKDFFDPATPSGQRIRARMGALLGQGVVQTLDEAYDSACWADPEVRAILQQRADSERAKAEVASTQLARQASTSVKSEPAGAATTAPKDIRAQLAAAAAKLGM
jgi:hypothetical protein